MVIALVGLGTVVAALVIEVAVRLATGAPLVLAGKEGERYVNLDPVIGRIPRAGLSLRLPDGFTVSTGDNGTRLNGSAPPRHERPLTVVVGDSFAFGDDVDDDESWPAFLERIGGSRVVNGGVPGFGLDQAVLRAEQLAPLYTPDTIVVALIPHDVQRCGMSYWSGHPKPYFEIGGGGALTLHPPPVPARPAFAFVRDMLSSSVAMDMLFPRFLHWQGPEVVVAHDHASEVACALMQRLARLGRARTIRIVVVAHPQVPEIVAEDRARAAAVLACARAAGLTAVDLFPTFEALPAQQRTALFEGHLTAAGNRLVAVELARTVTGGATAQGDAAPAAP